MIFPCKIENDLELMIPQMHHAPEITALVRHNLDRLKKWMPWAVSDYSLETANEYIRRNLTCLAEGTGFSVAIVLNGRIAGMVGFHDVNEQSRTADIGYWITDEAEGRGLVTKSCRVFIGYLFDEVGLKRIQIKCNIDNVRSRAIPERLGFTFEGIEERAEYVDGKYGDWAVYAMLSEQWPGLQKGIH